MDRETAVEIQRRAFYDLIAFLGAASPGARVHERDGVVGAIVPAVPERSIVNSVAFRDAAALADAYDELASAYDEAGVEAWTVWTPEFDAEAGALLADAGHVVDGEPLAMVLELDRLEAPEIGDLDCDAEATLPELGELNDRAYDQRGVRLRPGLRRAARRRGRAPLPRARRRRARLRDGDDRPWPAAGSAGADCGVYFVATDPARRSGASPAA